MSTAVIGKRTTLETIELKPLELDCVHCGQRLSSMDFLNGICSVCGHIWSDADLWLPPAQNRYTILIQQRRIQWR